MKRKMITKKRKKISVGQIGLHIFFILACCCYAYPLLLTIAVSFEGAENVGFSVIPQDFTLKAYEQIFATPQKILKAYAVTGFSAVASTALSLVLMTPIAYALSRRNFKFRNIITFILFFTTLFSGGTVSSYLLITSVLHWGNTLWVYIVPGAVSAWNVIVIRTFFQGLPESLCDAARIDGASELRICFQIMIPLATPALASIGFLRFIADWNSWFASSLYIRDPDLYTLQYLLKIILDGSAELQKMIEEGVISGLYAQEELRNLESLRFAMAIVAAGPMLAVFPFFQKYFSKGLTLGSVKG